MSAADEDLMEGEEEQEEEELVDPTTLPDGPKTIIVGGWSRIKTVTEALQNAEEGDLILCKAGEYNEKVVLDRNGVTISGPPGMECSFMDSVVSKSFGCQLSCINISGGVEVKLGDVKLTECNIHTAKIGLTVYKTASPQVSKCSFHSVDKSHIYLFEGSRGVYTENTLQGKKQRGSTGVYMDNSGTAVVESNSIKGVENGFYICNGCNESVVKGNVMDEITSCGLYVDLKSSPSVVANEVVGADHYALMIAGGSEGVYKENLFFASVKLRRGCRPTLSSNITLQPHALEKDDEHIQVHGVEPRSERDIRKWKAARAAAAAAAAEAAAEEE